MSKKIVVRQEDRNFPDAFGIYMGLADAKERGLIEFKTIHSSQEITALIVRAVKKQRKQIAKGIKSTL